MRDGIRLFLEGLLDGVDRLPEPRDVLLDKAPVRVTEAWVGDLAAGYHDDPASHLEPLDLGGAMGPVVLRGVRFTSLCAHHLLPFRGEAHVGFVPRGKHVGLGGIARLIDSLSRRLCLQESLTGDIADHLVAALDPEGVIVILDAEHLCLAVRGARKTGHRFRTVERRGNVTPELESALGGP